MPTFCQKCGHPVRFDETGFFPAEKYAEMVQSAALLACVTPAGVVSTSHEASVVQPRHALWVALRELGLSYPQIGQLAERDHTTVMGAIKRAGPAVLEMADDILKATHEREEI